MPPLPFSPAAVLVILVRVSGEHHACAALVSVILGTSWTL